MGSRGDLLKRGRHFVGRWCCCTPPPAPSGLTAGGGGGSGEVMVTWDPLPATAKVAFYRVYRANAGSRSESFLDTLRRIGLDPFKIAANGARFSTGRPAAHNRETEAA